MKNILIISMCSRTTASASALVLIVLALTRLYVIQQSIHYAKRLVEDNRKDKNVVASIVGAMGSKLYSVSNSQASKPRCRVEYVNNCG